MKSIKNLTRFTYETAAFQGWRLTLSRRGSAFIKYFSDKKYDGEKKSFAAGQAEEKLACVREAFQHSKLPDKPVRERVNEVLAEIRHEF